jgi:N-acetylneuraminic acid mutarotase
MLAAIALAAAATTSAIGGAPRTEWQTAPPMQHARAAHAVVSTGEAVYALAGTGVGGRPVLEVERFDGDVWRSESALPGAGLNAPAAAFFAGKIYVIGGFDTTTNVPVSRVQVYDVRSKTWSAAAPLPKPRGGHAAVVLDDEIHVFGGGNSQSTIADHTVYNPDANKWRDAAPLPRAEGSPAGVVHRRTIYAVGGRSGPSDFGDVYLYDATKDAWLSGPKIEPRGTAGAVEYCGEIHVFGGESQALNRSLGTAQRLDDSKGTWLDLPSLPTARSFARAVILNDAVFVVGGARVAGNSHESPGSAVVERYQRNCRES